ncbi:MAG: LAGLIDADG family homing endonuclease [Candidatus Uhrbacteria bacterium]|nr:LAGLIDADG family homing endonuclease [Candidatus Uhrbacteria bacterium]
MPLRWTKIEEQQKYSELYKLYITENKTILEIAKVLGISYSSVYERILRLDIPLCPFKKEKYRNIKFVELPPLSIDLAEFMGIMFGDGHRSDGQLVITINSRDDFGYIAYVRTLIAKLFSRDAGVVHRTCQNTADVYFSSVKAVLYLEGLGLTAKNKVREQVDVPSWVRDNVAYSKGFIRGFFDTDGSIYRLRNGSVQMSFSNRSKPLLDSLRRMLLELSFHPSKSTHVFYLTRKKDLQKYISVIGFGNPKHVQRAHAFGYF